MGTARSSATPVRPRCECKRLTVSRPHVRRYRYTLDDLYPMMDALRLRAESYDDWALTVNEALEAKTNRKESTWCGDGLAAGGRDRL